MSNKKNHKPEETQENQNTKNNAGEQANETVQEENNNNKQSTDTDKTAEYEATIADLKDKYLRQAAEFDNYRKRVLKEKSELIQNGGESVISSLLPIIDDFERALQNMKKSDDTAALKEGVELIYQKFMKTLESNGLKTIETKEADFNTDFHEAVAMIPAPNDESKGKGVDWGKRGYEHNDKVIRHAKVAVGQ